MGGAVSTLESWTSYLTSIGREVFVYTMTVENSAPGAFQDDTVRGFRSQHLREWFYSSVIKLDLIGNELITLVYAFKPNLIVATDLYSAQLGSLLRGHLQIPWLQVPA